MKPSAINGIAMNASDHFTSSPAVEVGTGRALRSLSSSILKAMGGKPTPASTRNATTPQES